MIPALPLSARGYCENPILQCMGKRLLNCEMRAGYNCLQLDHRLNISKLRGARRSHGVTVCVCVSAQEPCLLQHFPTAILHGSGLSMGFHHLCLYSGGESTVLMC